MVFIIIRIVAEFVITDAEYVQRLGLVYMLVDSEV
jgi:hypothetical protein